MRVLAIDLGASSVRLFVIRLEEKLLLKEISRFETPVITENGYLRWDFPRILSSIKPSLENTKTISSIGIDAWGVDFGLVDENGELVANPISYRDHSHRIGADELKNRLSPEKHYSLTGIQPLPFNTAAQLLARKLRNDTEIERAHSFLLIPDLVASYLGDEKKIPTCEITNASTTQLLGLNGKWCEDAVKASRLDSIFLPKIAFPGTLFGSINKIPIIRVASHDTASAVFAIPSKITNAVYISSGTWSLVGTLIRNPMATLDALEAGFTHERAYDGSFRFLKNVMGLWLLQRSQGKLSHKECIRLAESAPPWGPRFDVNHPSLLNPVDMPSAIRSIADSPIENTAVLFRAIFENLAKEYAQTIEKLRKITSVPIESIHIVGGGSQNTLLNRMTSDATGLPVYAGPIEATAIGNALVQLLYHGKITEDEKESLIRKSFPIQLYEPKNTEKWREWAAKTHFH
ncbi:MAG TPA: FGGY-family carbohydrate kinase [Fimbriimonadales bacterium]|nr:FGGY-family carbohydrate kinase [Fimbriimonadales bacterium]